MMAETECVYCAERKLDWCEELFEAGTTGEPACPKCFNEDELGGEDG